MRLGAHYRRAVPQQQSFEGLVLRRAHALRVMAGRKERGADQDRDQGRGGEDHAVAGVLIAVDQEELQGEDDGADADAESCQMGVHLGFLLHPGGPMVREGCRRLRRDVMRLPGQDGQTYQDGHDQRRRPSHPFTRTHLVFHASNVRRSLSRDRCFDES
jgi:hypothetical protein